MVLGGASDGDSEVSETKTVSDKGSPHDYLYWLLSLVEVNQAILGVLSAPWG